MRCSYSDIRDRISEQPKWWDERGVPRYCDFSPREVADIYSLQVALVSIECQSCGREFKVAFSSNVFDQLLGRATLEEAVRARTLHYGDPPNIGCCPAGATMSSILGTVLEFWEDRGAEFERRPDLEGIDLASEPDGDDAAEDSAERTGQDEHRDALRELLVAHSSLCDELHSRLAVLAPPPLSLDQPDDGDPENRKAREETMARVRELLAQSRKLGEEMSERLEALEARGLRSG